MRRKHRNRIHPAVAVAAIIALTVIVLSAEYHSNDSLISFKLLIVSIIAWITGVKMRRVLPIT